ncbi:uncharacterized protein LOC116616658 [Nematostella vectensis]|uniref:uncharacterized protein LOC116616658 n=1 Tax=Nematostella vectensis TaxID=45351 RepID=UPI0020774578|nr:uncharacterized protein LOC116616658 [Nematostella vectensis]
MDNSPKQGGKGLARLTREMDIARIEEFGNDESSSLAKKDPDEKGRANDSKEAKLIRYLTNGKLAQNVDKKLIEKTARKLENELIPTRASTSINSACKERIIKNLNAKVRSKKNENSTPFHFEKNGHKKNSDAKEDDLENIRLTDVLAHFDIIKNDGASKSAKNKSAKQNEPKPSAPKASNEYSVIQPTKPKFLVKNTQVPVKGTKSSESASGCIIPLSKSSDEYLVASTGGGQRVSDGGKSGARGKRNESTPLASARGIRGKVYTDVVVRLHSNSKDSFDTGRRKKKGVVAERRKGMREECDTWDLINVGKGRSRKMLGEKKAEGKRVVNKPTIAKQEHKDMNLAGKDAVCAIETSQTVDQFAETGVSELTNDFESQSAPFLGDSGKTKNEGKDRSQIIKSATIHRPKAKPDVDVSDERKVAFHRRTKSDVPTERKREFFSCEDIMRDSGEKNQSDVSTCLGKGIPTDCTYIATRVPDSFLLKAVNGELFDSEGRCFDKVAAFRPRSTNGTQPTVLINCSESNQTLPAPVGQLNALQEMQKTLSTAEALKQVHDTILQTKAMLLTIYRDLGSSADVARYREKRKRDMEEQVNARLNGAAVYGSDVDLDFADADLLRMECEVLGKQEMKRCDVRTLPQTEGLLPVSCLEKNRGKKGKEKSILQLSEHWSRNKRNPRINWDKGNE